VTDLYLANSHRWLHDQLTNTAELDADLRFVEGRRAADIILYTVPPWPDPGAPEPLTSFRARDLLRVFVFSQEDVPLPWAPGMYASLESSRIGYGQTGGFYIANNHDGDAGLSNDLETARGADADLLWSFIGTLSNHPVRTRLATLERGEDAVVRDTQGYSDVVRWDWSEGAKPAKRQAHAEFAALIGRSRFVVCPRGRGAGSIRLFEAMQAGRCPVIISDAWVEPPFVDWGSCSLRIAEADVEALPTFLRGRASESARLGAAAREAWENHYSAGRRLQTLGQAALALRAGKRERASDAATAVLRRDAALLAYRRIRKTGRDAFKLPVER
jgi:hypothetical protein